MFQGAGLSDGLNSRRYLSAAISNGTWSQLASQPAGYSPEDYASATLADGRVVITGGEYNLGNLFSPTWARFTDPVADAWTSLAPPTGWGLYRRFASVVLPMVISGGQKIDTLQAD